MGLRVSLYRFRVFWRLDFDFRVSFGRLVDDLVGMVIGAIGL